MARETNLPCFLERLVATMAILSLLSIAACERNQQSDETTLQRIQREGVVRIGYANEAPYAYADEKSGRLTGEAPEIARVVLKQMGIERIEGVLTEFGSLIPGLKAQRPDRRRRRSERTTGPSCVRARRGLISKNHKPIKMESPDGFRPARFPCAMKREKSSVYWEPMKISANASRRTKN